MSQRKKDGRGSSSTRPSASSLTDAVVAALAQVEAAGPASEGKGDKPSKPPKDDAPKASSFSDEKTAILGGVGAREDLAAAPDAGASDAAVAPASAAQASAAPASAEPASEAKSEPAVAVASAPVSVGDAPSESAVTVAPTVPTAAEEKSTESSDPEVKTEVARDDDTAQHATDAASVTTEPPPGEGKQGNEATTAKRAALPVDAGDGLHVDYFGRTDVGLVREHNEDNFLVVELTKEQRGVDQTILHSQLGASGAVFAVCDGMGGAAAGEVASQMAVDTIHEMLQNAGPPRDRDHFARRLVRSIEEAGSRIFSSAKLDRSRRGMGTTATVAGLVDNTLFVGQVGDSRAYVLRGDQFALITKDQSLVNQLIEAGQLTEEEAEAFEHSNIILQALGTTEEVTVDLTFLELRRGDRLLMCSDGLSGLVHADMMKEVLRGSRDLIDAANQLIAMANAGGGHDNITVVLAEFNGNDLKEPTPDARVAYQQYPLPPEDPKDPDPSPRAVSIKSGGPKPGHDVKGDPGRRAESLRPASLAAGGDRSPGGRWFLVGVLMTILAVLAVAIYLFLDQPR